ncbi:MAG TPA: hypothetical protein VGF17_13260, partial [Phytomonospora sp.]
MTRAKPDGVPAEAVWSPDDGEWVLAERDDDGRMQGVVTYWRPDGTLVNHCSYADGVPHGWFKRYHENGEVSRAGTFHHGELTGVDACYRSTGETTELAFPVHAMPANVWRYERDIAGGRSLSGRWFDKEGRQVDDTGGPLPERPGNVPAAAVYFAGSRHWALGVVDGKGEQGLWRYWSPEGTPLGEREVRDGRELDRRWFLGADHAAAVTALRDGRAEEALTAARAFWDRADSVEEVVHAGSVLAEVLAGDPAADAERRELLAIVGEAGDYPVVFSPEGFSCYRAQSRALGWLAAIKLDDGDPATAVVLSRQALAREHHFGPCAARVTLFHALARLGLVEDAFALVRETLGADAGFAGFEEVVADPAYREWVASLDVSAMTVEDALEQTGPGALDETAAAVRVEGGAATGTWPLREVLGARLSPELDRWLDLAGELPETAFDGE